MQWDWTRIEQELREATRDLPEVALDRPRIERLAAETAAGLRSAEANRLSESPEPPERGQVEELTALSPDEQAHLRRVGLGALERGEVAVAVLNGGMATRFGGRVKGIVEAVAGRSFLEIKHLQARRYGGVPLLVMNSLATHRATLRFLEEKGIEEGVHCFVQSVSLRLTPEGQLFRDAEGRISPYAPGHGDFPEALATAGLLALLERRGVRALTLSNVDNLGAEPDPLLIGFHLERGKPLTVEVSRAIPGDVGGAPLRVAGRLQLVEGFRFPRGFDFSRVPFVNTNSFIFSPSALAEQHPLSWFYVEKEVAGRTAVQMERLVGELSAFVDTAYVGVPRHGPALRYFPVKSQSDLEELRADPALVRRFSELEPLASR
jgi:UTP--glucose-1-phosphate uridylyltransferase